MLLIVSSSDNFAYEVIFGPISCLIIIAACSDTVCTIETNLGALNLHLQPRAVAKVVLSLCPADPSMDRNAMQPGVSMEFLCSF